MQAFVADMQGSHHFGLIGGLGVGATVLYYEGITNACAARGTVPRLTIAHANAPTALKLVQAGSIDGLADYLARFARELQTAGATFAAIPAITPHICRTELKTRIDLPLIDILDVTARHIRRLKLTSIALFGTKFTLPAACLAHLMVWASSVHRTSRSRRYTASTLTLRRRAGVYRAMRDACVKSPPRYAVATALMQSCWLAPI